MGSSEMYINRIVRTILIYVGLTSGAVAQNYIGQYGGNLYDPNSTSNPYGTYGSQFGPNSVNNPYGTYGSPYSPYSATNPYATQAPQLYDSRGGYHGTPSANPYDPNST